MDPLTALDATFLELEELDDGALMSIGATMVFDPSPDGTRLDLGALRSLLAARLEELPRYSQRLSSTRTGGLSWPHWEADPQFDAKQRAFYYARVIEIPTPRWPAYDAKRFGVKPPPEAVMTLTERAYTSPIWYTPGT